MLNRDQRSVGVDRHKVDISLCKHLLLFIIIALMCRALGVCVMLGQEMKCIVGHKKELSNVGAPSFLLPRQA